MTDEVIASGGRFDRLLSELDQLKSECSEKGWNGYAALPASDLSCRLAAAYARQLPQAVSIPIPSIDNRGRAVLQWGSLGKKFLSLKFGQMQNDPVECTYGNGVELDQIEKTADDFSGLNQIVGAYS